MSRASETPAGEGPLTKDTHHSPPLSLNRPDLSKGGSDTERRAGGGLALEVAHQQSPLRLALVNIFLKDQNKDLRFVGGQSLSQLLTSATAGRRQPQA